MASNIVGLYFAIVAQQNGQPCRGCIVAVHPAVLAWTFASNLRIVCHGDGQLAPKLRRVVIHCDIDVRVQLNNVAMAAVRVGLTTRSI